MSSAALVINLAALAVYGYSAFHLNSPKFKQGMAGVFPRQLEAYGQLKFLTYQCLLIQILSSALHVLAHFVRPLRRWRDLVFSTLAYPVGSLVVFTFWGVWIFLGRELILPEKLDKVYPLWLNHTTHTIIVPINIVLAILVNHKYISNGFLMTLIYTGLYAVFLHVIKAQTGLFVYPYLNELNDIERLVYFAFTGVFAYLMYKKGQFLTFGAHGGAEDKLAAKQKAKPKQKQK